MTLKRIDLTGNMISEIDDAAFSKLTLLEELSLAENRLAKLPALPAKLTSFNANSNLLKNKGVKANAFKVRQQNPALGPVRECESSTCDKTRFKKTDQR